jgi:hypothetical protein
MIERTDESGFVIPTELLANQVILLVLQHIAGNWHSTNALLRERGEGFVAVNRFQGFPGFSLVLGAFPDNSGVDKL